MPQMTIKKLPHWPVPLALLQTSDSQHTYVPFQPVYSLEIPVLNLCVTSFSENTEGVTNAYMLTSFLRQLTWVSNVMSLPTLWVTS